MRNIIAFILLIFLLALSCIDNSIIAKEKILNTQIEHRVTYTRKGTRSEAKHGHLWINRRKLPDVFTLVKFEDRVYKFYQRRQLWGRDGYFPIKESEKKITIRGSDRYISDEYLFRGWYMGDFRFKHTPSSWIYVKWRGGGAFVSPHKIDEMISVIKIKIIPRFKRFPFRNINK